MKLILEFLKLFHNFSYDFVYNLTYRTFKSIFEINFWLILIFLIVDKIVDCTALVDIWMNYCCNCLGCYKLAENSNNLCEAFFGYIIEKLSNLCTVILGEILVRIYWVAD